VEAVTDADPQQEPGSGAEPGSGSPAAGERPTIVRRTSVQRSLGSIVLGFESVIVFLAALVAFGLKAVPPVPALVGGAVLCLALVGTAGLLRYRWGFIVGWVLQVLILASALLVPLMLVVVAVFGSMWVYCMIRGAKIDRTNAALDAVALAAIDDPPEHPAP
jgi:hypothetical protein